MRGQPGPCGCGCGGITKGGAWLSGHNKNAWSARRGPQTLEMRAAAEEARAASLPPHSWDNLSFLNPTPHELGDAAATRALATAEDKC